MGSAGGRLAGAARAVEEAGRGRAGVWRSTSTRSEFGRIRSESSGESKLRSSFCHSLTPLDFFSDTSSAPARMGANGSTPTGGSARAGGGGGQLDHYQGSSPSPALDSALAHTGLRACSVGSRVHRLGRGDQESVRPRLPSPSSLSSLPDALLPSLALHYPHSLSPPPNPSTVSAKPPSASTPTRIPPTSKEQLSALHGYRQRTSV